ncbi:hypothetical protein [Streptomonospora wellingtoniae]|uniref:Uncharacterized protein n=1 Tax=Streptomonospora wellingtoniae TaxID=3075544 RepID=A0ABU2KXJ7_9ACTN|nr:hypothetical protein [Streptomonospora sp. DSM 45055]MDT0303978.1 hypothetical protein [Streptomonospora sp. DSM 45055]
MAHHAPDTDEESSGLLPQSTLWRVVILLMAAAVLAAATLLLWATGGLARADAGRGVEPGTEVRTKMYTLTPQKAEFVKDDAGLTALQVRAELTSNDTKPLQVSQLGRVIEVAFPSGAIDASALSLAYVRHPEGLVFEVQPGMREKVVMTWSLRKAEADDKQDEQEQSDNPLAGLEGESGDSEPFDLDELMKTPEDVAPLAEKEDEVTLTFSETEFSPGFTDQSKSWKATDDVAAEVTIPLGKG